MRKRRRRNKQDIFMNKRKQFNAVMHIKHSKIKLLGKVS
jgi:hypothetical protein